MAMGLSLQKMKPLTFVLFIKGRLGLFIRQMRDDAHLPSNSLQLL